MDPKTQVLKNPKAHDWDYTLPWKRENVPIRSAVRTEGTVKEAGAFFRLADVIKAFRTSYRSGL